MRKEDLKELESCGEVQLGKVFLSRGTLGDKGKLSFSDSQISLIVHLIESE